MGRPMFFLNNIVQNNLQLVNNIQVHCGWPDLDIGLFKSTVDL